MTIETRDEKFTAVLAHIVMALASAMAIIPFWLLIAASFSSETYATKYGYKFFPQELSLAAYEYLFSQGQQIGMAYLITIIVTIIGTSVGLLAVSLLAYGLTQKDIPGVKLVFILILITMLFNGGLVPQYLIYSHTLHVKNTLFGLILPNLLMSGFTVILVKNYFQSNIPSEMIEAAEIDGAGQFGIFFKIVFPLSTPILATVGLMSAVSYWNDWTNGLYYITDHNLYSLQQLLNEMNNNVQYLANNSSNLAGVDVSSLPSVTIRLAIAVVAIVPIMCAYPFFEKYFAKGITLGSVKG